MALLGALLGRDRRRHERAGFMLYGAAVAAARAPALYRDLAVPDTLDGRFDMVGLHAFLLIRHLQRQADPGGALAQAVFDAMFSDMDMNLREIGVGDLSVGKHMRAMWEAFHGRAQAYGQAMDGAEPAAALAAALARNVWREAAPAGMALALARYALGIAACLAPQKLADLAAGRAVFPAGPIPAGPAADAPVADTAPPGATVPA